MFIDSHAHLTSSQVFSEVDQLLARAAENKIEAIVNICTDIETLQRGVELVKRYPWVYNAAATTPHDVESEGEQVFPIMEQHALDGSLVAVGETGLDYHYQHSARDIQQHFLRKYLRLALQSKLPVIIHCREAFSDFFKILDEEYIVNGKHAPGILHCFTGNYQEAQEVIKRGWYLSLSGIVTFKKSEELREVAKMVPLEQLLIETDTPYLAPQSKRGRINESSYLPEIAAAVASAKGVSLDIIAKATLNNAKTLFKI